MATVDNIINNIQRGAHTLLVQTPDEFLYTFNSLTYVNKETIRKISNVIGTGTLREINRGGVGVVYEFGRDHVLKISRMCPQGVALNVNMQSLCNFAMAGSLVFHVQNTIYDKTMILCPNYLTEGIIGSLLQRPIILNSTPSFMRINGTAYNNEDAEYPFYVISERLEPFTYDTPEIFFYFLFQIFFGLYIGQNLMRFTHYDLHRNNVMTRPRNDDRRIKKYSLGNGRYLYTRYDRDAVIIDYGHCRGETEEHIIVPRLKFLNVALGRDQADSYDFNPFYDIFCVLSSNLYDVSRQSSNDTNRQIIAYLRILLAGFFKIDESQLDGRLTDVLLGPGAYRPYPERLFAFNPMSINEFVLYFAKQFATKVGDIPNVDSLKQALRVNNFIYTNSNIVSDRIIEYGLPNDNLMDITTYECFEIPTDYQFNSNRYYSLYSYSTRVDRSKFRTNFEDFNRTIPGRARDSTNHFITVARMMQPRASIRNPFRFYSDCCRMDIKSYFQNNLFNEGIAINASYFNISTDFEPIGLYKTTTHENNVYETDNPISNIPIYNDFYASIVVDNSGVLNILPMRDARRNKDNYRIIITAGPILIWEGKIVFTDETIRENLEFQCRPPTDGVDNVNADRFADGLYNCRKINPSELKHLGNPNPRSALAVSRDGYVYFICVEGRSERGTGMDGSQLAQYIFNTFPNISSAINLDGGRSSTISWLNENRIGISNPTNLFNYPVGSILSYCFPK